MKETKRCPYCGEEIMAAAKKCRHCGMWLAKPQLLHLPLQTDTCKNAIRTSSTRKKNQWDFSNVISKMSLSGIMQTSQARPAGNNFGGHAFVTLVAMLILSYFCLLVFAVGVPPLAAIFLFLCLTTALAVPLLSATIRRLRDAGRDWAWIFISCVPFIGGFWLLAILCQPGSTRCPKTQFKKTDRMIASGTISAIAVSVILLCTVGSGRNPLI